MIYIKRVKDIQLNEAISEDDSKKYQGNFTKFCKELEKLSVKYGIVINGGVSYGELKSVDYDDDLTSGDLSPENEKWED